MARRHRCPKTYKYRAICNSITQYYLAATKCEPRINIPQNLQLLARLINILATNEDPNVILETTIKSFITILSSS